jgi:hypothetical protein
VPTRDEVVFVLDGETFPLTGGGTATLYSWTEMARELDQQRLHSAMTTAQRTGDPIVISRADNEMRGALFTVLHAAEEDESRFTDGLQELYNAVRESLS